MLVRKCIVLYSLFAEYLNISSNYSTKIMIPERTYTQFCCCWWWLWCFCSHFVFTYRKNLVKTVANLVCESWICFHHTVGILRVQQWICIHTHRKGGKKLEFSREMQTSLQWIKIENNEKKRMETKKFWWRFHLFFVIFQ